MLRHKILIILFILSSTCFRADAAPTELVPCHELFKLNPGGGIYFKYVVESYEKQGEFDKKKPFFTVYIMPSFEPESAIVIYKNKKNIFIVERLSSQEIARNSIHEQTYPKYNQLTDLPENLILDMPSISTQGTRKISKKAAEILKRSITTTLEHSKFEQSEFDGTPGYLDGTMAYYISSKNKCGWPFWGSAPGPAKDIDTLGVLLEKYLDGKMEEQNIITAAEKVLNHYKNK